MLNKQFQHWLLHVDETKLWAWLGHSDNASHFKSGIMMIDELLVEAQGGAGEHRRLSQGGLD